MVTSARASFVAFTSAFQGDMSLPWTGSLGPRRGSSEPGGATLPRSMESL